MEYILENVIIKLKKLLNDNKMNMYFNKLNEWFERKFGWFFTNGMKVQQSYEEELKDWDVTLMDGLENEPWEDNKN